MKQKLYCYVDETGQDTKGALFIVVVLVTDDEKDKLELFLEKALAPTKLKGKVFYRIEKNTKAYEAQTIIATEQAIRKYSERR